MYLEVDLPEMAIKQALSHLPHEKLLEFILELDLLVADAGFTDNLIIGLVKSMKAELEAGADINIPFIDWSKVK